MEDKTQVAVDILNNLLNNVKAAYGSKDWELVRASFDTAVRERNEARLTHPFVVYSARDLLKK